MATFPFPIPHGWFGLCFSHELKATEVKKVRFCGRDLVVFRTESGKAAALDNYCPHLGAPLHQGAVVGEALRCPFHHWQWGTDGTCLDIPYAKRIPARAVAETLPVQEMNGMVLAWHHSDGRLPYFEVQTVAGLATDQDKWGEVHYYEHDLPTCAQEIAENDVDEDRTILRWSILLTKSLEQDDMGKTLLFSFGEGVKDDIPIWRDKIYREKPVLCDGDGPIVIQRKWFSQFYKSPVVSMRGIGSTATDGSAPSMADVAPNSRMATRRYPNPRR